MLSKSRPTVTPRAPARRITVTVRGLTRAASISPRCWGVIPAFSASTSWARSRSSRSRRTCAAKGSRTGIGDFGFFFFAPRAFRFLAPSGFRRSTCGSVSQSCASKNNTQIALRVTHVFYGGYRNKLGRGRGEACRSFQTVAKEKWKAGPKQFSNVRATDVRSGGRSVRLRQAWVAGRRPRPTRAFTRARVPATPRAGTPRLRSRPGSCVSSSDS